MTRDEALARLRALEPAIRALGIQHLSIFGSTARGDQRDDSDVDLAATLDYERVRQLGAWHYFGIGDEIAQMLGARVDLITEPARRQRFQAEIDRDRIHVF